MAMRLGEMLIEAGLLTPRQMEETLHNQTVFGGRLGTNLLEMGYLREDDLATFLGKKLELPCATGDQLMGVDPEIIKLVPKEVAEKYRVVPLSRDRKRLTLAMLDPEDLSVIDAISFVTGFFIFPVIAPELRLALALEKYYDIKQDLRYIKIAEKSRIQPQPGRDESAQQEAPETATIAPIDQTDLEPDVIDFSLPNEDVGVVDAFTQHESAEREAEPLLTEPAMDDVFPVETFAAEPAAMQPVAITSAYPGTAAPQPSAADAIASEPMVFELAEPEHTDLPVPEPVEPVSLREPPSTPSEPFGLTIEAISEALTEAKDREEIAELITAYLGQEFDRVALFMIKGTVVDGWKALRRNETMPAIESLELSLDLPSVLKVVNDTKSFYLGPIPDTPANARLLAALGGGEVVSALLVPLTIMGKVVAIIYVDGGKKPVASCLTDLQKLVGKATMAFEILILKNKILMT